MTQDRKRPTGTHNPSASSLRRWDNEGGAPVGGRAKRPRDQLAKSMDIATGAVPDRPPTPEEQGKDRVAVERGRKGGAKAARQAARVCGGIRIPPLGRLCSAVKRRVPSKSSAQRWRVTVIGGSRAREIAELEAASAEAAIKRAIREHGIDDPHKQKRLAAYRVG